MTLSPAQLLRGLAVVVFLAAWAFLAHTGSAGEGSGDLSVLLGIAPIVAALVLLLWRSSHPALTGAGAADAGLHLVDDQQQTTLVAQGAQAAQEAGLGLDHPGLALDRLDEEGARVGRNRTLERVCIETVESGAMTKDLAMLIGPDQPWLTTQDFLAAIDNNLQKAMAK